MPEDFLLFHADLLHRYAASVGHFWGQFWNRGDGELDDAYREVHGQRRDALCRALGDGLLAHLGSGSGGLRLITKTPSVRNLEHVFTFFPQARLVILVRDGRAVVESSVRSFGWSDEAALQRWNEAARTITAFTATTPRERFRIVRYEDLVADTEGTLRHLFAFLGLDGEAYDYGAIASTPVLGSSEHFAPKGADGQGGWKEVARPTSFDPLSRSQGWSERQHRRFNRVAGPAMRQLGYTLKETASGGVSDRVWNAVRDSEWAIKWWLQTQLAASERALHGIYLYKRRFRRFI
jgi:hypothetical protein